MKNLLASLYCLVFVVFAAVNGFAQQPAPVPAPNAAPAPAPNVQAPIGGGGSGMIVRSLWVEIVITLIFVGVSVFAVVRSSNRQ